MNELKILGKKPKKTHIYYEQAEQIWLTNNAIRRQKTRGKWRENKDLPNDERLTYKHMTYNTARGVSRLGNTRTLD